MPRSKVETLEKGKNQDIKYLKIDILESSKFSSMQKDILRELLENNKKYNIKQCEEMLSKEKERKVR